MQPGPWRTILTRAPTCPSVPKHERDNRLPAER